MALTGKHSRSFFILMCASLGFRRRPLWFGRIGAIAVIVICVAVLLAPGLFVAPEIIFQRQASAHLRVYGWRLRVYDSSGRTGLWLIRSTVAYQNDAAMRYFGEPQLFPPPPPRVSYGSAIAEGSWSPTAIECDFRQLGVHCYKYELVPFSIVPMPIDTRKTESHSSISISVSNWWFVLGACAAAAWLVVRHRLPRQRRGFPVGEH